MKELYFIIAFLAMKKVPGKNENMWRQDSEGNQIYRNAYQHSESEFGWDVVEVDSKYEAKNFKSLTDFSFIDEGKK